MKESIFKRGSNQYKKVLKDPRSMPAPEADIEQNFGIARRPGVERALYRFHASWDAHVWTAAAREGNTYTLPEVRTLISGVSVGGKTTAETQQVESLIESNQMLFDLVATGEFRVDKGTFCRLHSAIAKHEALGAGFFRGEQPGPVMSGGTVQLANGGTYQAPQDGIAARFNEIVSDSQKLESEVDQACFLFCHLARLQPFFDGNKRTSLALANGHLMSSGHDAILIPAKDRALYNNLLDKLFAEGDVDSMSRYLRSLLADPHT
ncbi:Fic family protein [Propionimicrobium lymphophilum]|uniref:Fido domain-containing protein n=1 Tax=Propionimicrobium lymphophilum ACS-093-V-SCH5 TaxID=883161 RepID=S2W1A0_9ACTN|nr:Fic family protein [Propionimicrobium lymphophilum]EPD32921.1 hypothetical protein HMPREF9306_01229 [Propionimicrobium lymphophilum ACS-093-V-SCH5]MDK7710642.1 Fic family protein [Propionimicrobium lymphophilum]MDK7734572.1 Fic family protein [Propionimicrobium lymphophilum]